MKNTLLLAVAVISIATVSCKKERTCECTSTTSTTYTSGNQSVTTTSSSSNKETAEKQSKKFFRMDNGCYGTTTKTSDTGTSGGQAYIEETTVETSCDVK
jgi:hypothetical protein